MTGDAQDVGGMTATEVKRLINDLLEQEALVVGGLVALHRVDDGLIWRLVKNLDAIRGKVLRRIDATQRRGGNGAATVRPSLRPHPAVEELLRRIRSEQP